MPPIRQLSASVVNKIAAGEVIERPASVVKELLENSVDAGAQQIELTLEKGGIELIRVTDDGVGIPHEELPLAVTSHATSKIADADDLFRVGTFGFRGEALASISEISQTLIRSRTAAQDCGYELAVHGGRYESPQPCGCPTGTTIEVRQLFYNTPVRGKFLRTPQTEQGHIGEAFTRVALANPHIKMTLIHNGKTIHQLPATEAWTDRIHAFFGAEISDRLIPVANHDSEVQIEGYVVDPSVSRANNRLQYLFLNSRYIRDRSLQHALSEAYRGLLMTGRFPICFLNMHMPFELVDVNVHPAKLEVRFQNGGQVYSQLLSTIRNRFLTTDLTAYAQLSSDRRSTAVPEYKKYPDDPGQGSTGFALRPNFSESQNRIPFEAPVPSMAVPLEGRLGSGIRHTEPVRSTTDRSFPQRHALTDLPVVEPEPGSEGEAEATVPPWPVPASSAATVRPEPATSLDPLTALQVHNTYLIQETEEGMVVIDQHALHERIIYEQLRAKVLMGKLESQKLLVPEPVTLPPAEAAAVLDESDLLETIGVWVEPFGGDTVLVTAYPAMLAHHNPGEMLRSVVEALMSDGKAPDQRELVDDLLHMISCKAAVKAGDKLSPQEITALLEHRELCQDAHHCPHGRPTSLVFSRKELDRRFGRI